MLISIAWFFWIFKGRWKFDLIYKGFSLGIVRIYLAYVCWTLPTRWSKQMIFFIVKYPLTIILYHIITDLSTVFMKFFIKTDQYMFFYFFNILLTIILYHIFTALSIVFIKFLLKITIISVINVRKLYIF